MARFHLARTIHTIKNHHLIHKRWFSGAGKYDALVLSAYTDDDKISLSSANGISTATHDQLLHQLSLSGFKKKGDVRVLYDIGGVKQVAVVSLGKKIGQSTHRESEIIDSARMATSLGIQAIKNQNVQRVGVDISVNPHGAAEGAVLAQFSFDKLKDEKTQKSPIRVVPFSDNDAAPFDWETGQIYATSQNLARMLMTSPANLMTPKLFSEEVAYLLAGLENTEVLVHDEDWASRHNMNALLTVAKGRSEEALRFLEIRYTGGKDSDRPVGLVGKGVTFDAGGISLKPSNNMSLMKGDMGGAATVAGTLYGISKLRLPINVVAVTPLCENLPSGKAVKPGDVIKAMNGKSIEILDTDAEGRLILADALYYISSRYNPRSIIDVATLTGAMDVALGRVFAGVFTNSEDLWRKLEHAGNAMADPFWRMPLHEDYLKEMESPVADLGNIGKDRSAGSCTAAMFLKEFVAGSETRKDTVDQTPSVDWAHIDIAGVMESKSTHGYNIRGMSGRPTRSLIEYVRNLSDE